MGDHHRCATGQRQPGSTHECWRVKRRSRGERRSYRWSKPPTDTSEATTMMILGLVLGCAGILLSSAGWFIVRLLHIKELNDEPVSATQQHRVDHLTSGVPMGAVKDGRHSGSGVSELSAMDCSLPNTVAVAV